MDTMFVSAAMSTPSLVLRYAAAFFFMVVAIFMAYALFKAAKALERVDKVLADVDKNGIPLMQKAGDTLDGVNANLGNVDEITKDVAGSTDKRDKMATSVEGAATTPARTAAAFSVGGIAAGAALAYYVQKRRAHTGEGYLDILRQLPSDAQRWAVDAKRRAALALEEGKAAARERDSDYTRQRTAASSPPARDG